MEEKINAYRVVVRKGDTVIPLGRLRSRWEDKNILRKEMGWITMDWIALVHDRDM
jgi:hypothetical protein